MYPTVYAFFEHLQVGPVSPCPVDETWETMIQRIRFPSTICEIPKKAFDWFLQCLPPKWMARDGFAFAEGAEALTLFWNKSQHFYCRQLTMEETWEFCLLAGISNPN